MNKIKILIISLLIGTIFLTLAGCVPKEQETDTEAGITVDELGVVYYNINEFITALEKDSIPIGYGDEDRETERMLFPEINQDKFSLKLITYGFGVYNYLYEPSKEYKEKSSLNLVAISINFKKDTNNNKEFIENIEKSYQDNSFTESVKYFNNDIAIVKMKYTGSNMILTNMNGNSISFTFDYNNYIDGEIVYLTDEEMMEIFDSFDFVTYADRDKLKDLY